MLFTLLSVLSVFQEIKNEYQSSNSLFHDKIESDKISLTQIGGKNPSGELWSLNINRAIKEIQARNLAFFMNLKGQTYPIVISQTQKKIELTSLGSDKNLILELPDCPK